MVNNLALTALWVQAQHVAALGCAIILAGIPGVPLRRWEIRNWSKR